MIETIVVLATKLMTFYPWNATENDPLLKPLAVVSRPITCCRLDEGKSILYAGLEDGSVLVPFFNSIPQQ